MMSNWTRAEKTVLKISVLLSALLVFQQRAYAMHIMEGYLPLTHAIVWGIICIPFLVAGVISIKYTIQQKQKALILLAMAGAFIFVLSSLKIPSLTGSCSHMTGTGLGAILFGPIVTSVLGIIVLLFQAILLAHGGLTTLGANTFSMAIAGPVCSWSIYMLGRKLKWNRKITIFFAAAIGDLFTYCVTSFQLAIAFPSANGGVGASVVKFLGVFAPTQLPLAIMEGIITVLIIMGMENYASKELTEIGYRMEVK